MIDAHHGWNASYKPQFLGLTSSLILTFAAYRIVIHHHLEGLALIITVLALAGLQAVLQLIFFLHLGLESKPHWGLLTFLFTFLVLIIIVGGTLWIMGNLNYDLMPTMTH